jgi:hypothetical protein
VWTRSDEVDNERKEGRRKQGDKVRGVAALHQPSQAAGGEGNRQTMTEAVEKITE